MNEELIQETQKLLTFESYSGKEKEVSDYVEILMKRLGFRDVFRDEYGSVFGFIGPKQEKTAILFDSHTDVMPVRGKWKHPPFAGEISNGKLYGRGSADMKGPLCASIFGAIEAQKNNSLKKQYAVSASVLEEEIEGIALGRVMDRVKPENVVICEPSKLKIKLGHKGRIECLLYVNGKTFHSAFPEKGDNTIHLAAKAINALQKIKFTNSHEMGEGVLTPTGIITNSNTSMAPSETAIRFDRRTVPGDNDSLVEKEIMDIVNKIDPKAFSFKIEESKTITYSGEEINCKKTFKPWTLDKNDLLVKSLTEAVKKNKIEIDMGYWGFCTNGVESMGNRQVNTIGFGPGDEELAHTTNEYIELEQLNNAYKVYKDLIIIEDQK
ncbi:MAG: Succinyl-diaminopimelate desuccinylase [Alphaproteobacteria bacterium MarineAlpha5_Bin11]|nr:peptidase M20 [Pelagibacteraceae bacterium]PPR43636.1 MAG: Succinyl-diaminopimelate desuccinylase [Alphaproteobacteria bacterium MarineAlpha5_Bin11]PPR51996.1 MAG: Succinyl-diaminopimelate desuccinylase [Alphaproteobacteria bacterium MarineAlpha5_Bin10]|tara:strand:+ start:32076 stop:33218 length:1143 start_codon:yes stop_codon:yes gene_type:complete